MEDVKKRQLRPRRRRDYGPNWPDGKEQRQEEQKQPRRRGDRRPRGGAPYDQDVEP